MTNTLHNDGRRWRRTWWLACLMAVAVGGCGAKAEVNEKAALEVMDKFKRNVQQRDYRRAMKCFSPRAQERVRNIGGADTPLESFFYALRPMIQRRTRVQSNRDKVWVTHIYGEGTQLIVGMTEFKGEGWLITSMKGDEWGI